MASSVTQPVLYLKPYYISEETQKAVTTFLLNVPRHSYETQLIPDFDIFIPRANPAVEGCFDRITLMMAMNALADISYSPWIIVRRTFLNLRSTFGLQARPLEDINRIREFLLSVEVKLMHFTKEVLSDKENKARRNWLMGYGANGAHDITLEEIDLRVVKEHLLMAWDHKIRNIGEILGDWNTVTGDDLDALVGENA